MMVDLVAFIILSFAAYRVTRFLLFDTLIDEPRNYWYRRISGGSRGRYLRDKLLDLTSCSWCTGVWVSFFVYWIYRWINPIHWGRLGWISFVGIAGLQGILHAFEPSDD